MAEEAKERRRLTRAEIQIRNAARQVETEKAITHHERPQKALYDNRARLKAERLARETELKAKGMTPGPRPKPPKGKCTFRVSPMSAWESARMHGYRSLSQRA